MVYELFAFTGLLAWIYLAGLFVFAVWIVGLDEHPFQVLFWVGLAVFAIPAFSDFGIEFLTALSWQALGAGVAVYLAGGILYGTTRWFFLVKKIRVWWDDNELEGEIAKRGSVFKADESHFSIPPHPRDFKIRITNWMAYWPFSIVAWALSDLLADLWAYIYASIGDLFSSISSAAWGSE